MKVGGGMVDMPGGDPPVVRTTGRPGVTSNGGKVVPEVMIDSTVVAKQEQLYRLSVDTIANSAP